MNRKLVFATRNMNKIFEISKMLPDNIEVIGLKDINCTEELPETHNTIEENSLEKAEYFFNKYDIDCFAEDSGLEIDFLNGAPGVHSAHYSGSRDPKRNITLILKEMSNTENREAQFKTVFTLKTTNETLQFTGIVTGNIGLAPKGLEGFGYDPIFIPTGYTSTFAEMQPVDKIAISHRTKAFILLKEHFKKKFIL